MKKHLYILLIISIIVASGCASTRASAEKREEARTSGQESVQKLLESGDYFISVNKVFPRRNPGMDLVPDKNFLSVTRGTARINLAYIGRSFSIRPISAINVRGKIEDLSIRPGKKGSTITSMKVIGAGERFNVNIRVSYSGDCYLSINNGMLDSISYRGKIGQRSR
jgi:hypothetical protein